MLLCLFSEALSKYFGRFPESALRRAAEVGGQLRAWRTSVIGEEESEEESKGKRKGTSKGKGAEFGAEIEYRDPFTARTLTETESDGKESRSDKTAHTRAQKDRPPDSTADEQTEKLFADDVSVCCCVSADCCLWIAELG